MPWRSKLKSVYLIPLSILLILLKRIFLPGMIRAICLGTVVSIGPGTLISLVGTKALVGITLFINFGGPEILSLLI